VRRGNSGRASDSDYGVVGPLRKQRARKVFSNWCVCTGENGPDLRPDSRGNPNTFSSVFKQSTAGDLSCIASAESTGHNVLDAPLYESKPQEWILAPGSGSSDKTAVFSQAQLGRNLGDVSRQNISNMEYGRRPISRRMAMRLSAYFGVSVDKLIG